ncbi:MAG TPA: alpha/beta hydrolase family protein [Pyrinomonadaceae bacterium]|jgi:S-formylglutathione hydrolase FrmB
MKRTPLATCFGLVAAFTAVLFCPILAAHNYAFAIPINRDSAAPAQQRHLSSASVETIQFHSTLTGKTLPYSVILPPHYRRSLTTRYPVLYLLHGLMGHYTDWVTKTNVADYAAQYRIIVVTPEGNDGWYTDSATVPSDKYESYFMKELIPDVQKRYRTIETRYGRAVAGLSMGGYGAVKFGLKYPESFVFAASISGSLTIATASQNDLKYPAAIRDSIASVLGPEDSGTRIANDLEFMVRSMQPSRVASLPYFYFDCGTEDLFLGQNARFAGLLYFKKIPHEYRQLPGNHNWAYWAQRVQEVIKIAAEKLHAQKN